MNKKILLIDDDEDEMDIFVRALQMASLKYDCVAADSGDKALVVLDSISPDVIFMDMNMPRMNGLECLKIIRERKRYNNTPVILYSTGIDKETMVIAKTLGASACIKKPDTIVDLSKILSNLFVVL